MSHSACPHCASTNSIETAGQRYCADCGQLISAKKEVKKKPQPKAIAQKAPAKPRVSAPPLNLKAIEQSRVAAKKRTSSAPALDLRTTKPKPVIKKPIGRHVPPAATAPVQPSVATELPPAPQPATRPVAKKFRHVSALRDGFKSVTSVRSFQLAFAAAFITTLCEVVFMARFASSARYALAESLAAGSINSFRATTLIGYLAWAGVLGYVGYLVYHYALAHIIYRTSRIIDRRATTEVQARRAALGSLASMFTVDALTWVFGFITLVLVIGANVGFLGTKSLGVVGQILAILTNAIVAYVWLGLLAARHMATYAIVLGQVSVRQAYTTGWTLYNRQFGRLTAGLIVATLVGFVVALPASIISNIAGNSLIGLSSSVLVVGLAQAVILIVGAVYFLRLYRFIIAREYDSELGHLLSGRQPQKAHVGRRLTLLGGITVIWVIVMGLLIVNASSVARLFTR